ncbi:MAG: sporulation integral membrane protein YtvI [Clostridia bacterium]|nr:sporulation integral membrane protein YtvI [Clostridia bacterium]
MNELLHRYSKAICNLLLAFFIFILLYFSVKFLLPVLAPFVIAVVISIINEPFIAFFERLKIPRAFASVLSLLISISIITILAVVGVIKIFNELVNLQNNISIYANSISTQIVDFLNRLSEYYNNLPKEISVPVSENIKGIALKLQVMVTSMAGQIITTLSSIPKMTVFITVTLISTYFISSDRRKIRTFVYKQLPGSWSKRFPEIKTGTFSAILGYFKALLILMSFTFFEVSIGLIIIGADYALLMGLLVALSDAIPVVGTSLIMVPWIVFNFISGNIRMGLGLTIIYLVGVIIRQIFEPKIVGAQIGLHPLVTLIAMYIGFEIFGAAGMLLGPIAMIVLKNLQSSGIIKLWRE